MAIEVELRFRAADAGVLSMLEGRQAIGTARLGPARRVDEVDRYLDTEGGRFAAERWALRLRTRQGSHRISLKGPPEPGTDPALHRRPELEGPADGGLEPDAWPPGPARDMVDRIRAGDPLVERFRLLQARTERPVELEGRPIGTLTLDAVEIVRRGVSFGTLQIVELELSGEDGSDALEQLAADLRAVDGLTAEPRTKLEHALDRLVGR